MTTIIIVNKIKTLDSLWLFSKYILKSASHCAKNICVMCIHPVFGMEERVLMLLARIIFGPLWLKGMSLLPFLQCRFQYRLQTVGMLTCLKLTSFCKLRKIVVSSMESSTGQMDSR